MKTLASALLGTTALVIIGLGVATPAQARSDVGVYVGPNGFGVSVEQYRDYCRDPWYRHRHWNYCHRFHDDDYGYSNYRYRNYNDYDNDDWRWRRYHHHDRDDWGGEGERHHDRDRHRGDGGEGDHHHYRDGGEDGRDRHW